MPAFEEPMNVLDRMGKFDRPWFIAGGWAVDLFLGRMTRPHKDIEIAILRADQGALRAYLSGWEFRKVVKGKLVPWRDDESLEPPVHEIHASREGRHASRLEILLNEASCDDWVFRRNSAITRSLSTVRLLSEAGVPYLAPEIVLLYKAKSPGPRDELDFRNLLPSLGPERCTWLRHALEICHPGHSWISHL